MRKFQIALAVAVLFAIHPAAAATTDDTFKNTDCKNAQTQIELDYCADRDYQAEDKKLNALYRSILAKYNAKSQTQLKTAEKSWIAYRDSECDFETASSEGGSIQPMEDSICLANKTRARIKELQAQRDCAEGDMTCNAPN
jgi:uncharacterized protein YecT (DUF1311 family)